MQTRAEDDITTANLDDASNSDVVIDFEQFKSSSRARRPFWKSYPWIRQSDQMDCGPACMAMISNYYDRRIGVQFWRSRLSTGREGTSLFDLAQTAESCGFNSTAVGLEDLRDLDRAAFPVIALRKYHYVVVYKVSDREVVVGDPASGLSKMTHDEFQDGFEKAVLILAPNEKFFDQPESAPKFAHYALLLKGFEVELALSFLVSSLLVFLGLAAPILTQLFMDDILVKQDVGLLKIMLSGAAITVILNGVLGWVRVYYANFLATKVDFRAHSLFVKKMLSLRYKYFADRHVGDFTRRINEIWKLKKFILEAGETIITSVLCLAIYETALFLYSPVIAVWVFFAAPGFVFLSWISGRSLSRAYQTIFRQSADIDGSLTDSIKGIATIKSLGAEMATRWKYEEKFISLLKSERRFTLLEASLGVASLFYSQFVNFALMGLAGSLAIDGRSSPGQAIACVMISNSVLTPLVKLAGQFGQMQEVKAVCERLNDIFLSPSDAKPEGGQLRATDLKGEIEFKDVWFRYGGEGSDWILRGVSFKIEASARIAVVGPSGSGKSTIVALIGRMYEPTRGQIFVDGRDYRDYSVDWYRSQIGVLHQDSHLFEGSILSNIALSDPDPVLSKVSAAAQKAAAAEFIMKKPGGFSYGITPGGFGLSGGEKQRVAVARMLYRDPRILLLDEATSSLDGIAEHQLLSNLKRHTGDLTTINIAHRLSTVAHSDLVLVLNDGQVVGFGSHEQLYAENKVFQALFGSQRLASLAPNSRNGDVA